LNVMMTVNNKNFGKTSFAATLNFRPPSLMRETAGKQKRAAAWDNQFSQ